MTLYMLVRGLHLVAMSVWMGAGLLAPADAKSSLLDDPPRTRELLSRLKRTARLMNASAYATIATGAGLILLGPGVAHTPPRILWGAGLTLVAIWIGRWVIRPALFGMVGSLETPISREEAARLVRRFAIGVHGEGLVRLVVLALMLP